MCLCLGLEFLQGLRCVLFNSMLKVTIVSSDFEGKRLIQRQRSVNQLLSEELAGPVHALAQHTYTLDEWNKKHGLSPDSPNCLGGGAK